MRSYLIDELSSPDLDKAKLFFEQNAIISSLENIFWIKLPDDVLTAAQFEHQECQPHVFAVEVGKNGIKIEFFIRSSKKLSCSCSSYSTFQQANFIIRFAQVMIDKLDIKT